MLFPIYNQHNVCHFLLSFLSSGKYVSYRRRGPKAAAGELPADDEDGHRASPEPSGSAYYKDRQGNSRS